MDLWQFFCYLDGYELQQIEKLQGYLYLAQQVGIRTGQYFSGKKAPDASIEFDRLSSCSNKVYMEHYEEKAEEKIDNLKEQLKLFD